MSIQTIISLLDAFFYGYCCVDFYKQRGLELQNKRKVFTQVVHPACLRSHLNLLRSLLIIRLYSCLGFVNGRKIPCWL